MLGRECNHTFCVPLNGTRFSKILPQNGGKKPRKPYNKRLSLPLSQHKRFIVAFESLIGVAELP